MKTAFFEIFLDEEKRYFESNLLGHELSFFSQPINLDNVEEAADFDIVSTFVNCKLDATIIDKLPNLKAIFARSTGIDVIDVNYANSKNIKVYNVPSYGAHTVAEFTFALMLALVRNIPQAVERTKIERKFSFENLRGMDLNAKTLGVIGTGKIGQNVIRMARGFNMNVIAHDLYPNQELVDKYSVTYLSLQDLLQKADIVTLHAPYTKANHHMLNEETISLMKKGAYLINTARGGLIDTYCLYDALTNGHLAGAALDVLEEEQSLKEEAELLAKNALSSEEMKKILENHLLLQLPNVIVTPHLAFYSKEAQETILKTVVENIRAFEEGIDKNLVTLK